MALSGRVTARLPVREGEPYSSLFVFCYVCISSITFRYYFFPRYFKNLKRSTLWNKQYTKNAINCIFKTKSSNDKSVKTAKNYQKNQTKLNTTPRHVFMSSTQNSSTQGLNDLDRWQDKKTGSRRDRTKTVYVLCVGWQKLPIHVHFILLIP